MNPNPKKFTTTDVEKSQIAQNEEKILDFWRDNNIFQKTLEKESPNGNFVFFEGPPTANGRPGIHHVLARSFKDIIPRYKTMQGYRVQRKAGWDTHGLPVELQVEKQLGLQSKKEIEQFGLAAFNAQCRESVWEYKDEWEKLTERMGYWIDMEHPYVTYDNNYIEALWGIMKKIDEREFLYRDFRVGPWCTRCGTGLSSHELNQPGAYKDIKDLSAYVKFKISNRENTYLAAWTTTPWTLPGNVALAVGENIDYVEIIVNGEVLILAKELISKIEGDYTVQKEYKGSELTGIEYEPLYPFMSNLINNEQQKKLVNAFKVYTADFVTTTDGTGIVHIAPMYGADDFELATKNNLPKFHVVNEEGKYITGCDTETIKLSGRYVKEKDENGKPTLAVDIVNDLTARGLLLKKENYAHSYPHCWRCDTPLLYYARTSWYLRVSAIREQLLDANKTINWEPDHIRDGRFGEWLDGIKDWAISRDRYWGTPLPVWSTESGKRIVIGGLDDFKKYTQKFKNNYFIIRHGQGENNISELHNQDIHETANLTEEGIKQVAESSKNFTKNIDIMIVSPFVRTQQTAKIFCEQTGFPEEKIILDVRIGEWQVSPEFHGKSKSEFIEFYDQNFHKEPGKHFGNDESFVDVVKRVGDFLQDIEQQYTGKNIFLVAHSGIIRAFDFLSKEITFKDLTLPEHFLQVPENAEIRNYQFVRIPRNLQYELDFHKPFIDEVNLLDIETGEKLVRTPEVMDVWFDSGSMPIAQHHKIGQAINFDPQPADYISEGVDQTRGWFYTMHAIANLIHDNSTQAYKNVICLGLVLDANGQKMSKSKGNVVSPWEIFKKYGADVIRFWFYSVNQPGEFKNFDESSIDEVRKKVFNPLMNIVSFYEMYKGDLDFSGDDCNPYGAVDKNILDTWILARFDELEILVTQKLDIYNILDATRAIKNFINDFSTWYIRRSRDRFKSENIHDRKLALRTTQVMLNNLARVMAPFTPFIAEEIWQKVSWLLESAPSVHLDRWLNRVQAGIDRGTVIVDMEKVRDLVTLGLEARQKSNVKVRQPLASITIAENLEESFREILRDELNVKKVLIDKDFEQGKVVLDIEITDELLHEGEMRDLIRKVQDMRKAANLIPSDRITVYLSDSEPVWIGNENLMQEFTNIIGASKIIWQNKNETVEKNK